ncbi:putative glycoside hydrolase, partial [Staphylococcus aureus]|uniref:putative glycoside hydrolase n=1 Tax=Staphylococcus aureus TaxID=1280 RepID=UPI001330E25F
LYFADGKIPAPFSLVLGEGVTSRMTDSATRQEGALQLTWRDGASAKASIDGADIDLTNETNAEVMLEATYRVDRAPAGHAT